MATYSYLLSTRVGEAKNPGPCENDIQHCDDLSNLSFAVVNPTAIYKKVHDVTSLNARVVCLAETSATQAVQTISTKEAGQSDFKFFWSQPVASRKVLEFDQPVYRGESMGTAILTDLPCRPNPINLPPDIISSTRVSSGIIRFGCFDVLVFTIYGVTGATPGARRANDYLLASIYEISARARLPVIIGGDFNVRPPQLASFDLFRQQGYVEAFDLYEMKHGCQLPPTCNGKTRNDTFILHPKLIPYVKDMRVVSGCIFDKHSPFIIDFQVGTETPKHFQWNLPKSWKTLGLPQDIIDSVYERIFSQWHFATTLQDESLSYEAIMHQWSEMVEQVIQEAIIIHHKMDPIKQPLKGLPKKYRGRCDKRERKIIHHRNPVSFSQNGGFNPSSLAFTDLAKQKTKQVRRLESLYRSMQNLHRQNTYPSYQIFLQWKNEWQVIRYAKGFGKSWETWILAYEAVEHVPDVVPTLNFLFDALQITRHDCEATCKLEDKRRKDAISLKLKFDRSDNFLRNTYAVLKDPSFPPITHAQITNEAEAVLCRSQADQIHVRITGKLINFTKDREIHFGECTMELLKQRGQMLTLRHKSGVVPTEAKLRQSSYACTQPELCDAFQNFWSSFWNREKVQEQKEDEAWESIHEKIEQANPKFPSLPIILDDPKIWKTTIRKLKKNKAVGFDGWHNDDLHMLPDKAVEHLTIITQRLWKKGFDKSYMQAKVVLLPKNSQVTNMGQVRPVTILGSIYRLITKLIADQILAHWSILLPETMSGGVPGRGARLLMYMQQAIIEKSTIDKKQVGGFVLDLVKAFNCIPRRPLRRMMNNMGISYDIIDFWLGSLGKLTRLPQVGKHLGEPISSSCGVPEGDALSVCAMISLAYHYHEYIIFHVHDVRVSIYADNWSWLTSSQKSNFKTLQKTLEFVSALRMQIDFTKSWAWSNATEFRRTLKDMENLFPDGKTKILVAQNAKELGVLVKYSRQMALGPLIDRINGAKKKLQKIAWMAVPIEVKTTLIQGAVWPFAFFGVEATGLGETHFRSLRRGAANVMTAGHKQASAWVATHFLFPNLQDPLFYVLLRCLSIVRNLADNRYLMALEIVQIAADIEVKQPFGPGTALGSYIRRAGWDISACGNVSCQALPMKCVNCLKSSTQEIKQVLMEFWSFTVMTNCHHRKGVPSDLIFHRSNTLKALQGICDEDVRGLILNITGGYQSGVTKSWCYHQADDENAEICQLCGALDTKTHRLLECPFYNSIRMQHPEAVHILREKFPLWIWHPISYRHSEVNFHDIVMHTKNMPEIPEIYYTNDNQQLVFFTDGACCDVTDPESRRAGFAIIQDVSEGDEQKMRALEKYSKDGQIPDCFQVVSSSHTPGMQTPARSELCAVALLLQSLDSQNVQVPVYIHTDASYVIKAVRHAESDDLDHGAYKRPNNDLVQILIKRWKVDRYNIVKVKAHEVIRPDEKLHDAWVKMGNCVADQVAKAVLKREHDLVKKMAFEIRQHNIQQVKDLKKVYAYMIAYNKISMMINKQEILQQDGHIGVLQGEKMHVK